MTSKIFLGVLITIIVSSCGNSQKQKDTSFFYQQGKKVYFENVSDQFAISLSDSNRVKLKRNLAAFDELNLTIDKDQIFDDQNLLILKGNPTFRNDLLDNLSLSESDIFDKIIKFKESSTIAISNNQFIIKLKPSYTEKDVAKILQANNSKIVERSKVRKRRFVIACGNSNSFEVANKLYESGLCEFSHPNFYFSTERRSIPNTPVIPNDALFNNQWHLNNTGQGIGISDADIDASEAWDYTLGSANIRIAIIDDAVDTNHEDLQPNLVQQIDVIDDDENANPSNSSERHGTAVAGVAVARGNNSIGVSGSCPNCSLIAIRALAGTVAQHAEAIDAAISANADIISNSWGYNINSPITDDLVDAIDNAATNGRDGLGSIVLFAMTNINVDNCTASTPDISSLQSVIAVSRSTNQDLLGNAGFGNCMDVLAPTRGGTLGITTTDVTGANGYSNNNYTNNFGGTSSATPLVAGICGLILSINPDLEREEIQRIIEFGSDKIDPSNASYNSDGFSNTHGYGRVNAFNSIVPQVEIIPSKNTVAINEPFEITVRAKCLHSIKMLWWFGSNTGMQELDKAHIHTPPNQEEIYEFTWTDVKISQQGIYKFGANARDEFYPNSGDGFPHQASEGTGIDYVEIEVN